MEKGFGRPNSDQLSRAADHANGAAEPMRQVAEDLDKLLRSARPNPSEATRKQLKEMSQRQASLEHRTEQLQQKLSKLGEEAPIFGPGPPKMLQEAAGQMGDAQGKLGDSDARGASSHQADALERLEKFAQSMKQKGSGDGEGSGMPMPFGADGEEQGSDDGNGRAQRSDPVEIPSADQSHAPAEFRRDILDAMKDKAPEKYKDKLRDYYEDLVK